MIIFDLICSENHVFEGWFGSSEDYHKQKQNNLLSCPHCGSNEVQKSVMAPNIGMKSNQRLSHRPHIDTSPTEQIVDIEAASNSAEVPKAVTKQMSNAENVAHAALDKVMVETLTKVQNALLKESTWVGHKFTDEVRAIHYGESDHRQIHGHVSKKQASDLIDEGIDIAPLPMPYIPPDMKN